MASIMYGQLAMHITQPHEDKSFGVYLGNSTCGLACTREHSGWTGMARKGSYIDVVVAVRYSWRSSLHRHSWEHRCNTCRTAFASPVQPAKQHRLHSVLLLCSEPYLIISSKNICNFSSQHHNLSTFHIITKVMSKNWQDPVTINRRKTSFRSSDGRLRWKLFSTLKQAVRKVSPLITLATNPMQLMQFNSLVKEACRLHGPRAHCLCYSPVHCHSALHRR